MVIFMLKLTFVDFEKLPCLIDQYECVRLLTPHTVVKLAFAITPERLAGLSQKYIEGSALPVDYCQIAEQTFLYTMPKIDGLNLSQYAFHNLSDLTDCFTLALQTLKEFHQNDIYPSDIHEGNIIFDGTRLGFIDLEEAGCDDLMPIKHFWHKKRLKNVYDLPIDERQKSILVGKMQLLHLFLSATSSGVCHLDYDTIAEIGELSPETQNYFNYLFDHPAMISEDDYLEDAIAVLHTHENKTLKKKMDDSSVRIMPVW